MDQAEGGEDCVGPWPTPGEWLSDYLGRTTDFWQRTTRSTTTLSTKFGQRSVEEHEWTVDTVTADIIEAWEELTPLIGEGLDLWLELVQRSLRAGRPHE